MAVFVGVVCTVCIALRVLAMVELETREKYRKEKKNEAHVDVRVNCAPLWSFKKNVAQG